MRLIGRLVATLWFMGWLTVPLAFAQIDPRAQVILDRYGQRVEEALAARGESYLATPIDTLKTVTTITVKREEYEYRSVDTTVVDRLNERLASTTWTRFDDDMSFTRFVYDDGTLQGVGLDDGLKPIPFSKTTEAYHSIRASLAERLEASLVFMADPNGADRSEPSFARYDGPVSYGGVLEGEQLTLDALPFALSGLPGDPDASRVTVVYTVVYAPDGSIVGLVWSGEEKTFVVYGKPLVLPERATDYAVYDLSEGEVALVTELSSETTYNEPLNESWFDLSETDFEETP